MNLRYTEQQYHPVVDIGTTATDLFTVYFLCLKINIKKFSNEKFFIQS